LAILSAHVKMYPECVMNVPAISSHTFLFVIVRFVFPLRSVPGYS
jgi:hypothetical protein